MLLSAEALTILQVNAPQMLATQNHAASASFGGKQLRLQGLQVFTVLQPRNSYGHGFQTMPVDTHL